MLNQSGYSEQRPIKILQVDLTLKENGEDAWEVNKVEPIRGVSHMSRKDNYRLPKQFAEKFCHFSPDYSPTLLADLILAHLAEPSTTYSGKKEPLGLQNVRTIYQNTNPL